MKRASKAVGLVLITSAALLLGCKGRDEDGSGDFGDEDGTSTTQPYHSSRSNRTYSGAGFSSSSGHSSPGSSFSSSSSHGGFGSSGHAASS